MKTITAFILPGALLLGCFAAQASEHTRRLLRDARNGDTISMRQLGIALHKGLEVKRDVKNAIAWLKRAAANDDAGAQYYLGMMYMKGSGIPKNPQKAFRYLYISAQNGYDKAQKAIASLPIEYSAKWHLEQAEKGDINSMLLLAEACTQSPVKVRKKPVRRISEDEEDEEELDEEDDDNSFPPPGDAAHYYRMALKTNSRKAAEIMKKKPLDKTADFWTLLAEEQKDVDAMLKLADAYGNGNGLPVDTQKAIHFYRIAADEGDETALNIISSLPLEQTLDWWESRAEEGNMEAILRLAAAYDKGKGISANHEKAKKYYTLAADRGHKEALAWVEANDPTYKTPEQRRAQEQERRKQEELERSINQAGFANQIRQRLRLCHLPEDNEYLSITNGRMMDIWISLNDIRNGQGLTTVKIPVFQKVGNDRFFGKAQQDVFCVEVPKHLNIHFAEGDTVYGILVRKGDYTYINRSGHERSIRNYVLILGGN